MLESIEGRRGMVRFKPPLPAIEGLFGKPTVINNVISFATVPIVLERGANFLPRLWRRQFAWHASRFNLPATASVRGLSKPQWASRSARLSTTTAAAARAAKRFAPCRLEARSARTFRRSMLDTPLDYESMAARGGILGHGGIVVFDDTVDMARMARYAMEFLRYRVVREMHSVPNRLDSRHRGHRRHHQSPPGPREPRGPARSMRYDEVRLAMPARRPDSAPGFERAEIFSRRFWTDYRRR